MYRGLFVCGGALGGWEAGVVVGVRYPQKLWGGKGAWGWRVRFQIRRISNGTLAFINVSAHPVHTNHIFCAHRDIVRSRGSTSFSETSTSAKTTSTPSPSSSTSSVTMASREAREASADAARIHTLYEKQSARADAAQMEAVAARRAAAAARSDAERLAREVTLLRAARDESNAALEENNAYIRKLEARITAGGKHAFLIEQNTKLRVALADVSSSHAGCKPLLAAQRGELEKALKEIEVLATALEMRADELQLDGDLRSGLL
jgi:hypothetical protein